MPPDTPPADKSDKQQNAVKRILIADDRYENRYFLQALLEGNGYEIISAENGLEVLQILKTEKVDALISDILMPEMDGFQLCRTLKGDPELKNIPFIFYSASYTEQKDREFGLSLGANEYVSKPIEPQDFLLIIKNVLDQVEQEKTGVEGKELPDDLSYYTSYADTLGRKLQSKVVESEERKASARFNEEKYRIFLQNLQGIGYLLQVGIIQPLIFDGQVEEISGYHSKDFLAGTSQWETIVHPEDRQKYLSDKEPLGSEPAQKISEQYRIVHKNGDIRWVHEIASSFPGLEPDTLMIQGAIYDITLQIESKEQLRISEEHYRTLFETMIEGVVYLDEKGSVIDANPSAGRILGLTLEEIIGRTSLDPRWKAIHEDGSPFPGEDHPAMVTLRTGEKRSQIMGVYSPRDNIHRWIKVNAVPRFLPGKNASNQVYTTFEDITTEKEAHDHIKHLNRILKSLRMVNFLITGETKREILLNRICSSLTEDGGYSGIWIITDSDSGREKYQAISDNFIGDEFCDDISQEIITWMNAGDIPDQKIVTHSLELKRSDENVTPSQHRSGVMITRLSYEGIPSGMIGVCVPEAFINTPDEESLFLEIARDVGFALHHIHILHLEKSARTALSAREKQYRELVENISDTIFTLKPDGVISYVSPAISDISGQQVTHYIGKHFLDNIYPDDRNKVEHWFQTVLQNHTTPVEFRTWDDKNQIRYLRVKATPVRQNGDVIEVSGIISDITGWVEAEKIKESHTKEIQALLSLHQLAHETEADILSFALKAALDITQSAVGFIGFIGEKGLMVDFQIWSLEVMNTCAIKGSAPHHITSSSGLWSECINTKSPIIVNDYLNRLDNHGYPGGHIPIQRFLEVPILDGEEVTAIIAVANRIEPYSDSHAKALNTLGNKLWAIIHRKQSDREIKTALTQIAQNMEQLATLNDTIRNPLSVISVIADFLDEKNKKMTMEAVDMIDSVVSSLDKGWIQSEKVRNFLMKHYNFKDENF